MESRIAKLIRPALALCVAVVVGMSVFTTAALSEDPQLGGKSLASWMEIWERWAFGDTTVPTDKNGNAVVRGVVLMPDPGAPGDGTPASIDVTLNEDQPFVLPLWVLLGTSYNDGTPPDPFEPLSIFRTLIINFQIDGRTLVNSNNALDYFSKFRFVPAIPLPADFSPISSIIWFEGIGVVHEGFDAGRHTLRLDAKNTQPAFGTTFEFHNTWNVRVKPNR